MKEYHVAVGGTYISVVEKITGIWYLSPDLVCTAPGTQQYIKFGLGCSCR